jgi:hypothetical protein
MGITIAYRGQLRDLARIEDFEDRLVDCALEMNAQVRIWRSWADDNPARMVCGVIVDLVPGQESTSLLLSPEGWLIGLIDIEDAEEGRLNEPPWCFVKTQFGSVEGHLALVEMLAALKREFLPDLDVSDEGGYWETRDLAALAQKRSFTQQAIDSLAAGLRRHGLNHEAAEDPAILLRHIERVAEQVHRSLRRPADVPPAVVDDENDFVGAGDTEATEKLWGEIAKQNRRPQEQTQRALAERAENEERRPLLQRAMDLLQRLDGLFRDKDPRSAHALGTLYRRAGDAMGGLAQALSGSDHEADDHGLRVLQLKRALRGAALARGALFPLRSTIGREQFDELFGTLKQMETDIV